MNVTIKYGLYTDDGEGDFDLQDYVDTKTEALVWFHDQLSKYPNDKVQVREVTFRTIAGCILTPIILD